MIAAATQTASPFHRLDGRTKLLAALAALIGVVTTPPDRFWVFAAYFALIGAALASARIHSRTVGQRLLIAAPFVFLCAACIPFLQPETVTGGYNLGVGGLRVTRSGLLILWNVVAKACFGILTLTLLIETTPFPDLLRALEQLRVPKVLILLASFAYRYLFVLADEVRRMKRARDARAYGGRWLWHAGVIGRMIGTLFLRSYERGERVYLAMIARGFNGQMPTAEPSSFQRADFAFLAAALMVFVALRIAAR